MTPVATVEGRALGCSVRVVVTRPPAIAAAEAAVAGVLRAIDASCSRFRADSELSLVNASPDRDVVVTPVLAGAVAAALRAARRSGGAVDPTVGRAVIAAGYDRDFVLLTPHRNPPPTRGGRWEDVRLDVTRPSVRVPRGVLLDLGATAKALAADLAAEAAVAAVGGGVLVSLGGDVAMRGEPPDGGWRVQVGEDSRAPIDPSAESVCVSGGGIATSSTTVRRWRRGAATMHHLVDPRTGLPASGPWRTATAAAATCVEANTASTAAIVLGADAAGWLSASGVPARLVDQSGAVLRLGGWPAR